MLWLVAGAEEPTETRVPAAFAPLHDSALVLDRPLPQLRVLVSGRRRELIKLYRSPPVVRYTFLGDMPDTVRLRLGPADIDLPAGVSARVLDVRPREALLRFVSRDPLRDPLRDLRRDARRDLRADSLVRAVIDSVRSAAGALPGSAPAPRDVPPARLPRADSVPADTVARRDSVIPDTAAGEIGPPLPAAPAPARPPR